MTELLDPAVPALLEVQGLGMRFRSTVALHEVDWAAHAGEIHALVGSNGAGKSTLMHLLAGVFRPTAGRIVFNQEQRHWRGPADARDAGIATVYQEFSLVPQLSVARNIYLGRETLGRFGLVDEERMVVDACELLERHGFRIDARREVAELSVAEQQLVEIARGLSWAAKVLILDEPTAVLSLAEQDKLFSIARGLRAQGLLILFVSHHLSEVLAIADRVSVLRDGRLIVTECAADLSLDSLVGYMTGLGLDIEDPKQAEPSSGLSGSCAISWRRGRETTQLVLHQGRLTGIAGLVGAGRSSFGRTLAGDGPPQTSAEISFDDEPARVFQTPREALAAGVVYLSEDRKRAGIFSNLSIIANASAASIWRVAAGPFVVRSAERTLAATMLERLQLVADSLAQPIAELSGGNQQKVVLARALLARPRLLICDEPTRGVDISGKREIHRILRELAGEGMIVIMISTEIDEILTVSDRVVVMADHRFVADLPRDQASENLILKLAAGGAAPLEDTA